MSILHYKGPCYAADSINRHFSGDREAAFVLDVACGTGEVAKEVNSVFAAITSPVNSAKMQIAS